jgi:hypothetical protein
MVSEPILAEVDAVTARPALWRKPRVTPREARAVALRLRRRAVLVRPDVTIRMSRDPTDNEFLECAVTGGADYVGQRRRCPPELARGARHPDPRRAHVLATTHRTP